MGMMINRRRVTGCKKLPYDAEVEYLETDNDDSYINTTYIPTRSKNPIFVIKFRLDGFRDSGSWNQHLFGAYTSEYADTYRIIKYYDSNNNVRFCHAQNGTGGYQKDNVTLTLGMDYVIRMGHYELVINDISQTIFTHFGSQENINPLYLFSLPTKKAFKGRIYYFSILEGNEIVMDLIPVRVGTTGYMYDKVSGQLFGNDGTGAFILGPDK